MSKPLPGQRWISEMEPELGLGTVLECDARTVRLFFPASGETRLYALASAPVRRVAFKVGDKVQSHDGLNFSVVRVEEKAGVLVYHGEAGESVPEAALSDFLSFTTPEDRLLLGRVDSPADFHLRLNMLRRRAAIRKSPLRGFAGAKMDLLPHQLYIAQEVSSRFAPRVLLSDEVGLGKTIEACLILHRLHLSGLARRVLIVVPEPLVHQWFVELLRRFNLNFSIFDEERAASLDNGSADANPFMDDQLVLAGLSFLSQNPRRSAQAASAQWDLAIFDEAHHLEWSPEKSSPEFDFAEALAKDTRGLILLTATPEQLGQAAHFARLRLLDPDRYDDFAAYQQEASHYAEVAAAAGHLSGDKKLTPAHRKALAHIYASDASALAARLAEVDANEPGAREHLLRDLLDRHGTGRVIFRNTRASLTGFPGRRPCLAPLKDSDEASVLPNHLREFWADFNLAPCPAAWDFTDDPRVEWLAALLRKHKTAKVLCLTRTVAKAVALDEALKKVINVNTGLFHEEIPLIQRDRNAAFFADPDGARLLICSEIGSEGRNFQFAHHLVLFDFPPSPEMIEQRIGRLDRIGQTKTIEVHVPFVENTPQADLAKWLNEGVDAFAKPLQGAGRVWNELGAAFLDLVKTKHGEPEPIVIEGDEPPAKPGKASKKAAKKAVKARVSTDAVTTAPANSPKDLPSLIALAKKRDAEISAQLEAGRNRLIELNSFRAEPAKKLVDAILQQDADPSFEPFFLTLADAFDLNVEDLDEHCYRLGHGHASLDAFPDVSTENGLAVTFSRDIAKSRDELHLVTPDHPMVLNAVELFLSGQKGNACLGLMPGCGAPGLLLEAVFVLECIAAPRLHADQFLAPTALRIVVNHMKKDVSAAHPENGFGKRLQPAASNLLDSNKKVITDLLPRLIDAARTVANNHAAKHRETATAALRAQLDEEILRLKHLQQLHGHIRPEEITLATARRDELATAVAASTLRLDSLRLVFCQP